MTLLNQTLADLVFGPGDSDNPTDDRGNDGPSRVGEFNRFNVKANSLIPRPCTDDDPCGNAMCSKCG